MKDLGTLGGPGSGAYAINNAGHVAGLSLVQMGSSFESHAFFYADGTMVDIGTLGGTDSEATAINDFDQMVGYSKINGEEPTWDAFLFTDGGMIDIENLGGTSSFTTAINNNGQVVGYGQLPDGFTNHAFLYADGALTDLNDLLPNGSGWVLGEALGINDSGQIVGIGSINGQGHAFLMTLDGGGCPRAPHGNPGFQGTITGLDLTFNNPENITTISIPILKT